MQTQKKEKKPLSVRFTMDGGEIVRVFRCETAADVDNQASVEPYMLALASLPSFEGGTLNASWFTLQALKDLQRQVGKELFLRTFRALVVDMEHGFSPRNAVGVFISRVRALVRGGFAVVQEQE